MVSAGWLCLRVGVPSFCAVQISNPCRIVPVEIHCPSGQERTLKLPVAMDITLGENYIQSEHVTKFKRTTHNRQHKILSRVVTGSDRHDEKQLRQAISGGQPDIVRKLLDGGVNPCCVDEKRRSPLHIAAASGNVSIVKLLLESGANPNQTDIIGNTPLHLAACSNNIPVVTALLERGTDVNLLDRCGRSPLHLALGRLRMLQTSRRYTSDQLRAEVVQIIHMLQVYVTAVKSRGRTDADESATTTHASVESELDSLSRQLERTTTVDEIDSVSSLLSDLAQLQIEQLKTVETPGRTSFKASGQIL